MPVGRLFSRGFRRAVDLARGWSRPEESALHASLGDRDISATLLSELSTEVGVVT